jgi:hypothetical protein
MDAANAPARTRRRFLAWRYDSAAPPISVGETTDVLSPYPRSIVSGYYYTRNRPEAIFGQVEIVRTRDQATLAARSVADNDRPLRSQVALCATNLLHMDSCRYGRRPANHPDRWAPLRRRITSSRHVNNCQTNVQYTAMDMTISIRFGSVDIGDKTHSCLPMQ